MSKKTNNKGKSSETVNETSNQKEATMTKEFASMCGDAFDNKKNSSCHKMCKEENPESYAACLEDFKALSGHKSKEKAAGIVEPSKAKKKAEKL